MIIQTIYDPIIQETYKISCSEHCISVLSCLKTHIENKSLENVIFLIKYLLQQTQKDLFIVKGKDCDIIWIIFDILNLSVHNNDIIRDYINISKQLYFYQLTKAERMKRLPLLFCTIIVCVQTKCKYKKIYIPTWMTDIHDRMSYLYTYTEIDPECKHDIAESIKILRSRQSKVTPKSLVIHDKEYEKVERIRNQLSITKIYPHQV